MRCLPVLLLALAAPVAAQNIQVLDCPTIASGSEPCIVIEILPDPPAAVPQAQHYPLFRREEMAPDVPQLMIELLRDPTPANAERFLAWQQARQDRITYVQHLLRIAPRPQPGEEPR